jgi:hypothetical protein
LDRAPARWISSGPETRPDFQFRIAPSMGKNQPSTGPRPRGRGIPRFLSNSSCGTPSSTGPRPRGRGIIGLVSVSCFMSPNNANAKHSHYIEKRLCLTDVPARIVNLAVEPFFAPRSRICANVAAIDSLQQSVFSTIPPVLLAFRLRFITELEHRSFILSTPLLTPQADHPKLILAIFIGLRRVWSWTR